LRESGFEGVIATGRSGDGGIDGHGILQVNPFVSFTVLFQCKRHSGAVPAPDVRDFRGPMMGRADEGIIITTGTFTTEATMEVGVTKSGEGRPSFLTHELQALFADLRKQQPFVSYVFTRNGQPIREIRGTWLAACAATGVEGKTFHDFRRTAVRNLIRAGVPERVAMQTTGHKTRSVFERYNIVSETDLQDAVKRLRAFGR
jgi:hypothetical protein